RGCSRGTLSSRQPAAMSQIRIKYYGILPITKRGYLLATAVGGVVALGVIVVCMLIGRMPPLSTLWQPWQPSPARERLLFRLYDHLYHIILICIVLQIIDGFVVLRRFQRLEAAQRVSLVAGQPTDTHS